MIADQAQRLSHIAAEVLLASRLDAGDLPLAREPLDAARVAAATAEAMRSRLADDALLGLEVAPGVPLASGDPDKLRQILVNLVDNALKYSPEGTPVAVSVGADDRHVGLSVMLAERMGGSVGLVSEEGEGSTFWVELPLARKGGTLKGSGVSRERVSL